MEIKKSFLSWLFGSEPEDEEEEKLEEELAKAEEPQPETAQPEMPVLHTLELPSSHALFKLWALRSEQSGWLPRPNLTLEGPTDPVLNDADARKELLRLQMLVNSTTNSRMELLRPKPAPEGGEQQSSVPDLDAQVVVFLAKDALTAWLLVYPPVGSGKEVDRKLLSQALVAQQVCYGVDEALLDSLPGKRDRYFRLFPVARGTPPVPGMDGRVVDLFPRVEERKLTIDEHNRVDYTDLNFIHNVEADGVICRIIPPTDAALGRTVQNQEIPAKSGKPATVPKGRNTKLSEDGNALLASITGHVEFSGRSFQVKPVLDIPGDVDFSVGDINFLGDVCIHGDICSGFTVRAMGNITVGGGVEACTVEAGRDLVVARGVQGDNQAVLRSQRSIFAKYLENCCVYAKMNLETECVINCEVYCDGEVLVQAGHRSIIGGRVHAAQSVSAGIIGSRVENRTDVILGGHPCDEFDYDMLSKEVWDLENLLERTERQPDSPSKITRIGKLRVQLTVNRGKLDLLRKEREMRAEETQDLSHCHMECQTVFPGTVLEIGGITHRFDSRLTPCCATLGDDEILLI